MSPFYDRILRRFPSSCKMRYL